MDTEISQNALSVYGQDSGADDFPVLKAFQQYIDAEQNKARRRMVTLCIFFGALMAIVVAVFMFMLYGINERNQLLSDRLVEYAMRDRDRLIAQPPQPVVQSVPDNSANEAAMRAMTDTLVALQKQMAEQQQSQSAQQKAPPTYEEMEIEKKTREAEEKIRRARALLDAERKKLAEEREKLHYEEVERQRRRLYPEYYENQAATKPSETPSTPTATKQTSANKPIKPQISDSDIADILREVDEATRINDADAEDIDDDFEDAIEYFSDDEYQIPVKIEGTSTKWHVPLD